jgi:UDP-3-O-[3-hydroxymyristoyl] N-acetylglucosamine deacetylase
MPGLDGCALTAARRIMECSAPCDDGPSPLCPQTPLFVGDHSRFVVALPSSSFHVTCVIDYDAELIGTQILDYEGTEYLKMIAPARTFAMEEDVEALRAAGMALGGSLDNAILVKKNGVEAAGGLRFPDEFVRHKTLDLIGDLANLGRPLVAHVVAVRAGHVLHLQLVDRLRALLQGYER